VFFGSIGTNSTREENCTGFSESDRSRWSVWGGGNQGEDARKKRIRSRGEDLAADATCSLIKKQEEGVAVKGLGQGKGKRKVYLSSTKRDQTASKKNTQGTGGATDLLLKRRVEARGTIVQSSGSQEFWGGGQQVEFPQFETCLAGGKRERGEKEEGSAGRTRS